jgi:hypothetical protein
MESYSIGGKERYRSSSLVILAIQDMHIALIVLFLKLLCFQKIEIFYGEQKLSSVFLIITFYRTAITPLALKNVTYNLVALPRFPCLETLNRPLKTLRCINTTGIFSRKQKFC